MERERGQRRDALRIGREEQAGLARGRVGRGPDQAAPRAAGALAGDLLFADRREHDGQHLAGARDPHAGPASRGLGHRPVPRGEPARVVVRADEGGRVLERPGRARAERLGIERRGVDHLEPQRRRALGRARRAPHRARLEAARRVAGPTTQREQRPMQVDDALDRDPAGARHPDGTLRVLHPGLNAGSPSSGVDSVTGSTPRDAARVDDARFAPSRSHDSTTSATFPSASTTTTVGADEMS